MKFLTVLIAVALTACAAAPPDQRATRQQLADELSGIQEIIDAGELASIPRDSRGRILRSAKAKTAFKAAHPCPATGNSAGPCPGYVIDHIVALKRGGPDTPANMQWQTIDEAKAKDKTE